MSARNAVVSKLDRPQSGHVAVPRVNQAPESADSQWWRTAVIYQIYPRSFADGNGD